MPLAADLVRRAPKAVLHDHLDGGLRVATVRELAAQVGHTLPVDDEAALARWFYQGDGGTDLVRYLAAFEHTVAVLQTEAALVRTTREAVEDLAADGVVYAELRYAPELSTQDGLSLDAVFDALGEGLADAPEAVETRLLACIMRQEDRGEEVVAAALRARERGVPVVGVDLAGPEAGFPASRHAAALRTAVDGGLHLTLHAGEADGPRSIADALDAGAERLGHGVRIVEDIAADGTLGSVAARVHDQQVVLEVCPTSNVHTGLCDDVASHPIGRLRELGFAVTVSPDNRLMSGVDATSELVAVADAFGWDLGDLVAVTQTALDAAFIGPSTRGRLQQRVATAFEDLEA
ncbi:MAG: adenosine deaminase [Nitriliruptoraceae bacterium]